MEDSKKYALGFHFDVLCCGLAAVNFIQILQGYFSGTEESM